MCNIENFIYICGKRKHKYKIMKKSFLFLADGFEECEAIAPIDMLRRGGVEVVTVSVTGRRDVTGANDICVITDKLFDECDFAAADMLILPGGMPGAQHLNEHEGLKNLIVRLSAQNKWIAAICAAPMVLGGLGLLKGRKATCYPGFESKLTGATCSTEAVEIDGNIITGKGPGYACNFGCALLTALMGKETAQNVWAGMFP